jgi:hypothetical protein
LFVHDRLEARSKRKTSIESRAQRSVPMSKTISRVSCACLLLLCIALVGCGKNDPLQGCESCAGGCSAAACKIDCKSQSCSDRLIICPPDKPCELACNGLDACDTTTVECPAGFDCSVQCEGKDACGDMILRCSDGDCSIRCGTDRASCEGAVVDCGSGRCDATCEGSSFPKLESCQAARCTTCS